MFGLRRPCWWCLLTAPEIPEPHLDAWSPDDKWPLVSSVLNRFQLNPSLTEALKIKEDELAEFGARNPLPAYSLQLNCKAPTALHSWGCPTRPCPCGCRPLVSQARLNAQICSVLVPLEKGQFRHLSASEAALLNGLSPGLNFGSEPRLGLALVGQLSSPLQAAWVSNAAIHSLVLGGLVSMPTQTSTAILQAMREDLISEAVELGMFVQPEPVADTQMRWILLLWIRPPLTLEHHLLKPPVGPGPQVHIICPCSCLLGAFLDRMYLETGVIITQASRAGQLLARRDHLKAGDALELLVAKALGNIAGKFSQIQVIDPVAATCALQFQRHELLAPVNAKASHSGSFVTAVAVLGHWVSVHWRVDGPRVYAWTIATLFKSSTSFISFSGRPLDSGSGPSGSSLGLPGMCYQASAVQSPCAISSVIFVEKSPCLLPQPLTSLVSSSIMKHSSEQIGSGLPSSSQELLPAPCHSLCKVSQAF